MKLMFASDIHGSLPATERVLERFAQSGARWLIILGDVLNHGPRNALPEGYAPAEVAERLNSVAERIIAVRGNCDSEVDQMLLHFPCLAPYNFLILEGRRLCLTHGHLYTVEQLGVRQGDLILSGHTHLAGFTEAAAGVWAINPGSVTFPRNNGVASFAIYREGIFSIHGVADGALLMEHRLAQA